MRLFHGGSAAVPSPLPVSPEGNRPVANDKVFATLTLFEAGVLDKVQAILQLKTYTLWDQYLFHTQRSLAYLKYVGTVE